MYLYALSLSELKQQFAKGGLSGRLQVGPFSSLKKISFIISPILIFLIFEKDISHISHI